MSKEEEIMRLLELKDNWMYKNPPNTEKITDIISDLNYFRENTHKDFPYVNEFYFSNMEHADTFFEDAYDDLCEYLEVTPKNYSYFQSAMQHISNGIDNLINELKNI